MTFHELERADDENVSKKARVAKIFFDSMVRTVLNSMSTRKLGRPLNWRFTQANEGTLIDGFPADKVKAGDETTNQADERYAAVLLGEGDRHFPRQIDPAHRLDSTNESE